MNWLPGAAGGGGVRRLACCFVIRCIIVLSIVNQYISQLYKMSKLAKKLLDSGREIVSYLQVG